jgi:hypothetical protein
VILDTGSGWRGRSRTGQAARRKRKGRCPAGSLDERGANVAAVAAMQAHARELVVAASTERAKAERKLTVRELESC